MTSPSAFRQNRVGAAQRPHIAMPLGGIGTGNVAICADGSLRQWQLHNIGNHGGSLPWSMFAIRASRTEPPQNTVKILQADPVPPSTRTPLVTDDEVPSWQREALERFGGVASTSFAGTYPFAEISYDDDDLPLSLTLEAFTPLVPLDAESSSIPAAMFTFRIVNTDPVAIHGTLGATLQNAVGWDGVSPIDGVNGAGYGGNTNRVVRDDGWTSVVLENGSLPADAPGAGQMVLAADDSAAPVLTQWQRLDEYIAFLDARALNSGTSRLRSDRATGDPQRHAPRSSVGASASGRTWNTGIGVPFELEPGQEKIVRFVMAWHFPNRIVNFEQFGPQRPEWGSSRFWLGNHYATVFPDAQQVFRRVATDWHRLRDATAAWSGTLAASSLDDQTVAHLAAQLSLVRSPTCFRTADGRFFGFEGVLGASTSMWSGQFGGSCPLNCTHVWNYEQTLSKTFPELERSMRETEFDVMQAPEGYLPHRVIAPVYLRQLWDEPIGGPEEPALDGMLGAVLKTYREVRTGGGLEWLEHYWPNISRLMDHIGAKWDVTGTGMLTGTQPSTHDIDLAGLNTFMGTLWLAALRAAEEMALLVGETGRASSYRETFELASTNYDEALFNGEYYVQRLQPGDPAEFQWVDGCLSDQLIGQWWAHQLDLGYLLPQDHVRTALSSVVRYNLRSDFTDFVHPYRIYADGDDAGLLMCSWPTGGRPAVPTRYADEVWTGIEYQVAAHCLWEGLEKESQQILRSLWTRHDGRRRNPYNEIECGDHYARAMAGWSVLEAMSGLRYDGVSATLTVRPAPSPASIPVLVGGGWGLLVTTAESVKLKCTGGRIRLGAVEIEGSQVPAPTVTWDGTALAVSCETTGRGTRVVPAVALVLEAGQEIAFLDDSWH
ncbi:uncharacterized protein (DUF608 family) [Nakamurella sp. UYEF19]|uniref:GH116 family glycosyl-hydrolase n=1 Tax=Nakamurella sp. UYEF19 TaxID=1756392 RepID=UPI003391B68A